MTTRNILTLTLLATTLTLGAAVPRELNATVKQRSNSISNKIANTLFSRGIELDKAQELSLNIINVNEELFSFMVQTYSTETGIQLDEIYHELGKLALSKKSVDFSSYSFLLKLSQNIRKEHLSTTQLEQIDHISTKNQIICKAFV